MFRPSSPHKSLLSGWILWLSPSILCPLGLYQLLDWFSACHWYQLVFVGVAPHFSISVELWHFPSIPLFAFSPCQTQLLQNVYHIWLWTQHLPSASRSLNRFFEGNARTRQGPWWYGAAHIYHFTPLPFLVIFSYLPILQLPTVRRVSEKTNTTTEFLSLYLSVLVRLSHLIPS